MDYIVKIIPPVIEASGIAQWIPLLSVVVVLISLFYNNKKLDERQKEVSKFQQQQQQQAFEEQQAQQERTFKEQQAQQERTFKEQQAQQERLIAKQKAEFIAKIEQENLNNLRSIMVQYLTQSYNFFDQSKDLILQKKNLLDAGCLTDEKFQSLLRKKSEEFLSLLNIYNQINLLLDTDKTENKNLTELMREYNNDILGLENYADPFKPNININNLVHEYFHNEKKLHIQSFKIKELSKKILDNEWEKIKKMDNN